MLILASIALVLSIFSTILSVLAYRREKDYVDSYESGWDIGFDAALTMVEKHLDREPVNVEVTSLMRAKAAAMYQ